MNNNANTPPGTLQHFLSLRFLRNNLTRLGKWAPDSKPVTSCSLGNLLATNDLHEGPQNSLRGQRAPPTAHVMKSSPVLLFFLDYVFIATLLVVSPQIPLRTIAAHFTIFHTRFLPTSGPSSHLWPLHLHPSRFPPYFFFF